MRLSLNRLARRSVLVSALAAAGLALAACDNAGGSKGMASDEYFSLGNKDSKVTLVEYASTTCSHCAHFHSTIYQELKKNYIDTGKIRYEFREFATPPADVSMAGGLLARCAGKDKYFDVIDALMRGQEQLFATGDGRGMLLSVAQSVGMDETAFAKCVSDEKAITAFTARMERDAKKYNIQGTPSFFINGKAFPYKQGTTAADFAAALDAELKK